MLKKQNIYFVGLMGAGKTTIGRQLAKRLGKAFYDVDHEVEKRTGVKISVIFDLEGEEGFRRRESDVIHELTQLDNIVLATGGGAIKALENRQLLQGRGYIIYLQASVSDLSRRMRGDKNRPLLQNVDVSKKLEELYQERNPMYLEIADLVIETGHQNTNVVLNQIEEAVVSNANT